MKVSSVEADVVPERRVGLFRLISIDETQRDAEVIERLPITVAVKLQVTR